MKDLGKLHDVAKLFRKTAEECGLNKFVVMWGAILDKDELASD